MKPLQFLWTVKDFGIHYVGYTMETSCSEAETLENDSGLQGSHALRNCLPGISPEALLAAIVEEAEDVIVSKNLDGIIMSWNKGAVRIFGYQPDEIIGRSIYTIIPTDRAEEEKLIFAQIRKGERVKHFETVRRRKDGSLIEVALTISPIKDSQGKIVGASKVARDISRQNEAARNTALLAAIVDSSDDAIISKDLSGIITSWNRAAQNIFGYTCEEMIGQHITVLFPPDRINEESIILDRIKKGERVEHFETIRKSKDGRLLNISLTMSPIRDSQGRIIGASKTARDITDQIRAREELQRMNQKLREADRFKSEFLATMSHELRTPLNSIIGFTGIIVQEMAGPLNEEQKMQLNMVYNSARHLLSLINDLLDLSRIEAGKMEVIVQSFDPRVVVEEVVKTLSTVANKRNLQLSTDLQLPTHLRSDQKKYYQVLLNLVNNALKFTHQGEVKIIGRTCPDKIEMVVKDTGIGIKPEQLPLLFEAFRQGEAAMTRRYEGTGLGLYLCKKLVTLLGGEIWAISEFGKGSCFCFSIPVNPSTPGSKPSSS